MSRALVIPEATTLDYPVARVCDRIEQWAAESDDVDAINEAVHKLAAIDLYLNRTCTAGRARIAATMRRLEVRIGKVLGKAPGRGKSEDSAHGVIPVQRREEFRQMAEYPDVVEQVIAVSTDGRPASRRWVLAAIRGDDCFDDPAKAWARLYHALSAIPSVVDRALALWDPQKWSPDEGWGPIIEAAQSAIEGLQGHVVRQRGIRRVK